MRLRIGGWAAWIVMASAWSAPLEGLDRVYPSLDALYQELHRNPELSLQEEKTAATLAARMRAIGFEVTEGVGGHGVVAVLRNGEGPVVMLRTDLDALPVREQTGLEFASTATAKNEAGETVPVMHACGHDAHMASWVGAAMLLAEMKKDWRGTVVFIGQPAEEVVRGARAMVADGLMERFPKPDYVLGLHVTNSLPSGTVGMISGPASAASNAVTITFYGKGGHGAAPHLTVDPLLIAARTVVTLQTIVSREVNPFEPAVVTVGTFHAGLKRNVISDEARIELTVRSHKAEVQAHLLRAIERIAKAEAAAAAAPREPDVEVNREEFAQVVVNDPALTERLTVALRAALGESQVVEEGPLSTSEDFGEFGRAANAPSIQLRIGAIEPAEYERLKQRGELAVGPHHPAFAPDRERTIRTGVAALTLSALELLDGAGNH